MSLLSLRQYILSRQAKTVQPSHDFLPKLDHATLLSPTILRKYFSRATPRNLQNLEKWRKFLLFKLVGKYQKLPKRCRATIGRNELWSNLSNVLSKRETALADRQSVRQMVFMTPIEVGERFVD